MLEKELGHVRYVVFRTLNLPLSKDSLLIFKDGDPKGSWLEKPLSARGVNE